MGYFILYLIVGVLLSFLFRTENDRVAFLDWPVNGLIILFWPFVVLYMAGQVKRISWGGKGRWERKR